jgi:hypothetical protein
VLPAAVRITALPKKIVMQPVNQSGRNGGQQRAQHIGPAVLAESRLELGALPGNISTKSSPDRLYK